MPDTNSHQVPPTLFDVPSAAAWLHVSESWLRRAVSAGTVPHRRLSARKVRFTLDDLNRIVSASAAGTAK